MEKIKTNSERERILDTIEDWRSGVKATRGFPATGDRYARCMREEIKALLVRLREVDAALGNQLPESVYTL